MKIRPVFWLIACIVLAFPRASVSEDIDLFIQQNQGGSVPNVLLVIDTAANFSASSQAGSSCQINNATNTLDGTVGGIEQCALYAVIQELKDSSVNLGVMLYNSNITVRYDGTPCPASMLGGCLAFPMMLMNQTNKDALLNWISIWTTSGGAVLGQVSSNNESTGAVMQEAWAFFSGHTGISGTKYPPVENTNNCNPSNYVVFIGNSYNRSGSPNDQTGDKGPLNPLSGVASVADMNANPPAALHWWKQPVLTPITTDCDTSTAFQFPSGQLHLNGGFYADEWSGYMHDYAITTYSIGVLKLPSTGGTQNSCQPSYAALLTSMATEGGGKYFPTTNVDELKTAVGTAFGEISAKNSVFASVSLPVAVNTEGTYLNQVYIGMFRPDALKGPRWPGNLKQYKLGLTSQNALRLFDSQDQLAISASNTGFLSVCAVSYWTPAPTSPDQYWNTNPYNLPPTSPDYPAACVGYSPMSNTPDGESVEKGAAGYVLRGYSSSTTPAYTSTWSSRNMVTCDTDNCLNASSIYTLDSFNTGNGAITAGRLGVASTDRDDVINWALGDNNHLVNGVLEESFVPASVTRPSVHGDVLHSRPVALNYGTAANPEVIVFYAANDGALRAINGDRSAAITTGNNATVAAGAELWSFMPPEFLGKIKQLRDNSPAVKYTFLNGDPSQGTPPYDASAQEKPYGMDGPITSYQEGGNTWIFAGMRRGGRALYAFDVSNIASDPTSPTLLWKVGCTTDSSGTTSCTPGFGNIGQTWSAAQVLKTDGYVDTTTVNNQTVTTLKPMLMFGGGYDTCEDADPLVTLTGTPCTSSSTRGNGIYVLDAATGQPLTSQNLPLPTDRAVVGDVLVVKDFTTGKAQYAYAADTGGNIYRISGADAASPFGTTPPDQWHITKIASLGCPCGTSGARKFLFGPDVVKVNGTEYDVLIGSGDREKPLYNWTGAYNQTNYFFMVKDVPSDPSVLANGPITADMLQTITIGSTSPTTVDSQYKGWKLQLSPHEQVVTSAITVYGTTTFSTQIPAPPTPVDAVGEACTPPSTAYVYNVNFTNAAPVGSTNNRNAQVEGGGLPPSPVAGQVRLDDGRLVPFLIGGSPTSPLEATLPVGSEALNQPKGFTYWYIQK